MLPFPWVSSAKPACCFHECPQEWVTQPKKLDSGCHSSVLPSLIKVAETQGLRMTWSLTQ